MLLQAEQRAKLDPTDDSLFYSYPRFVTHVDDRFIQQLTELYRQTLKPNSCLFDMMSSWVSHLPEEMVFDLVVGQGMNEAELARNPRLDRYFLQDLNENQLLPLPDRSFDAVLNAVSVQYLQYPEAVFAEIWRILKPGGMAIVSFSNRMFYQKAIQAWREGNDASHVKLVKSYFASIAGFSDIVAVGGDRRPSPKGFDWTQWFAPPADPFFAVMARRSPDEPSPTC
ncbi:class I SAM-dependent methyltransferase [Synechococcus sp. PCC 7336]|uniref:class I SAM-dependent methyltransferase n=1 Tax=Synechococcus sp. PCC 7336 TaxID=195250 RepID=UPI000349A476|nr:class I SAM-dependent methyltransferase [Synechococcus sp. PCC 7336]